MEPTADNDVEQSDLDTCETINHMKEKLYDIQADVVAYVKENPIKAIGISIAAGIIVAQLFRSKK